MFLIKHGTIITAGCFFIFFLIEQWRKRFLIPCMVKDGGINRWLRNILFGVINQVFAPIVLVPITMYASSIHLWQRPDFLHNTALAFCMDLLILDFACYGFHRVCHIIPWLWRIHEVHHLDEAFDSTTGLRVHFAELIVQNIFTTIPIIIFVIPVKSLLLYITFLGIFSFIQHSNISFPKRIEDAMSLVLVTPKLHAAHHHAYINDTNSNYSFIFSWWDRLFNTFNSTNREPTWKMGLEYSSDLSWAKLLLYPFKLRLSQVPRLFSKQLPS